MVRIGLIGFGFIGKGVYRAIADRELDGLEVAFVWNRSADKLAGVPARLVLPDLAGFADAASTRTTSISARSVDALRTSAARPSCSTARCERSRRCSRATST